jgi:hypothetical protein
VNYNTVTYKGCSKLAVLTRMNHAVRDPTSLYNVLFVFVTGVTRSDLIAGQRSSYWLNSNYHKWWAVDAKW